MNKINKKFIIIIGIGVLFLSIAFIFKNSIKNEEKLETQQINTNLNLDKGRKTTLSQVEAYIEEEKDSLNNARNKSNMDLSSFGKLNQNTNVNTSLIGTKEKTDAEIIDSILQSHKIVEQPKKKQKTNIRYSNTRTYAKRKQIETQKREREKRQSKIDAEKEKEALRKKEIERIKSSFANSNYTKKEKKKTGKKTDKNIPIMVNGDQTIKKGARVNMLLQKDAVINGVTYKRNTKIYGFANFAEHRLFITINNIQNNPVKLKIYDAQDGGLGLYTKQNLVGEVEQEVKEDVVDEIKLGGVKVGTTIKKIFKKKNKEPKLLLFNRTKFIMN